jgi:streptogramin lyase
MRRDRVRNRVVGRARSLWLLVILVAIGGIGPSVRAQPTITEFPLPSGGKPISITAGSDGNLWFTRGSGDQIGRMTPEGDVSQFPDPGGGHPWGIAAGPDGNLWYTDILNPPSIGRLSPSDGEVTEFHFAAGGWFPPGLIEITPGPDGNLWFTVSKGGIGRMTPEGSVRIFTKGAYDSTFFGAWGITAGPDNHLWFTKRSGDVWRISLSGDLRSFSLPEELAGAGPDIVKGPDGNLWFTLYYDDAIGRITPRGRITIFGLPAEGSGPYGIAAGPDGNLWFTEYLGNRIGRITPTGDIVEYEVPTLDAHPIYIAAGPDGNMWFTEHTRNRIGRVEL